MNIKGSLFIVLVLIIQSIAGCTGAVLDTTVEPRAGLSAFPTEIQEGEMVTFDARTSDAIEGIIKEYTWDFGTGDESTTIAGFTSYQFIEPGAFTVRLTVTNDQGGEDSTTVTIRVNGAPRINLTIPSDVRAGDIVLLDASGTTDPENGALSFAWDLNHLEDSDGDGDYRNDLDSSEQMVYIPTTSSGFIMGSLMVDDGVGGTAFEQFEFNVQSRMFKVVWIENTLEWDFNDYLNQSESWSVNLTPGEAARVISYQALLELDQELFLPPDNFTLSINVVDDGHQRSSQTTPGNITRNETTSAELNDTDLNPTGTNDVFEADSAVELLESLLNTPGARFGQGDWIWTIIATDADPDSFIDGVPDPDAGNDWTLTITITVQVPVLTEIAYE